MKSCTIVIPTYWGQPGQALRDAEKVVFDHPSPLGESGTLPRCLESLSLYPALNARIVIIPVPNDPTITDKLTQHVHTLLDPYRDRYDISIFGPRQVNFLHSVLHQQGLPEESLELLNLDNYAAVRNMCLLAGVLQATDYTVFIDDDEVFVDPEFFNKIDTRIGSTFGEETIHALAGYYLQPDTWRLDDSEVPLWRATDWNNAAAMNQAFERFIDKKPRIKPVPFVFGGNMTITLELARQYCFDPNITRGEDIDYLINLRVNAIRFYLDRELAIKHLPPASHQAPWKKFREDALRFLYEQKKLRDHAHIVSVDDFQPYPGIFLDDDLDKRIIKTAELLKAFCLSEDDPEGADQCEQIAQLARNNPFTEIDTAAWLEQLNSRWQALTRLAEGIGIAE